MHIILVILPEILFGKIFFLFVIIFGKANSSNNAPNYGCLVFQSEVHS